MPSRELTGAADQLPPLPPLAALADPTAGGGGATGLSWLGAGEGATPLTFTGTAGLTTSGAAGGIAAVVGATVVAGNVVGTGVVAAVVELVAAVVIGADTWVVGALVKRIGVSSSGRGDVSSAPAMTKPPSPSPTIAPPAAADLQVNGRIGAPFSRV